MKPVERRRRFRFGFLLASHGYERSDSVLQDWNRIDFGGLQLSLHPETPFVSSKAGDSEIYAIGDVFSCDSSRSVDGILASLAEEFDPRAADVLSGRFALLHYCRGQVKAINDAFGARTVYYRLGGDVCLGSHASLVAGVYQDAVDEACLAFVGSDEYRARGTSYLPGDLTMHRNIRCLVPNHMYDSRSGGLIRFWPDRPLEATSFQQLAGVWDEYFDHFAAFVRQRYSVLLGLTGGVDSRALIAALKRRKVACNFFTWSGGRLADDELPVVKRMVHHVGGKHEFVKIVRSLTDRTLVDVEAAADMNTGGGRRSSGVTASLDRFGHRDRVFIRGYGGEIMRGFYNRHKGVAMDRIDPASMARVYLTKRASKPSKLAMQFVENAFAGFIERAGYDSEIFNVDPLDLLYWEQRMGVWGANMLNEMDPAIYSMAAFNSRMLYRAAFGLPVEERLGQGLMLRLTARDDEPLSRFLVES